MLIVNHNTLSESHSGTAWVYYNILLQNHDKVVHLCADDDGSQELHLNLKIEILNAYQIFN